MAENKETNEIQSIACDNCTLLMKVRQGEARIEVGSDLWKWVATSLSGALLAGMVFYLTVPANAVTRADMESFIQRNSPYAQDRVTVITALNDLKENQKELRTKFEEMQQHQNKLMIAIESHLKSTK